MIEAKALSAEELGTLVSQLLAVANHLQVMCPLPREDWRVDFHLDRIENLVNTLCQVMEAAHKLDCALLEGGSDIDEQDSLRSLIEPYREALKGVE